MDRRTAIATAAAVALVGATGTVAAGATGLLDFAMPPPAVVRRDVAARCRTSPLGTSSTTVTVHSFEILVVGAQADVEVTTT